MDEGWIKIHRKLATWGWYKAPNMVHLFVHLLLHANYHESEFFGHKIERGQVVIGLHSLVEQTGISFQSLRTCLERLKSTNEITIKTTSRFSIVTICNYEEYQRDERLDQQADQQTVQQASNKQVTSSQQHPKKVINKEDQEEEIRSSPSPTEQLLGIPSKPSVPKVIKVQHGAYRHVHLSESEFSDWRSRVGPVILERMIEKLDSWIEQERENPKGFKKRQGNGRNAAACFRSWVHSAVCEERQSSRKFGGSAAMDADASERARLRNKQSMQEYKQKLNEPSQDAYEQTIVPFK